MVGIWIGTYKMGKGRLPKERRGGITKFILEITEFDGKRFSGFVEDDLESGGTKGRGEISGEIVNGKVNFIKQMPIATYHLKDEGRIEENKPHRKIYYSGILKENTIQGSWRFKFGFGRIKGRIAFFPASKGIWEMRKA